jgi:hypothetical protein
MKLINKFKGRIFRKLIDIADNIDIWIKKRYNINLKQVALEQTQDRIPLSKLDNTIGKSLNIMAHDQEIV